MALEKYRQKRDITRTPEPAGKESTLGKGGIFVVQKHSAKRLHYDFRLEMDGVLKSWAVPKGPSLDPAAKRLAVHVEDHPLDYAEFEGVIPPGGYGAGTVMVWDRGLWQPVGDVKADFAKGALKFRLEGEKLRGLWALIRMRNRNDAEQEKENWLLIKERDADAKSGSDGEITGQRPDSVLTGRTMDEIAAAGENTY
jgi:bifunctional non-homologous end joining protein LigD